MSKKLSSAALAAPLLALLASGCTREPLARTTAGASQHATPSTGSAAALPAAASPVLRFAVYGDTRDHHDIHQDVVDKVLSFTPALVLQTGDLVHYGDALEEWVKFDEITGALRRRVPYYPARGNHDVSANHYYEDRVTQPVLSGNKLYYSFEKEGVHFVALDTEQDLEPGSEQAAWLEADLARARAEGKFIVPFFHKAIFSIGPHSAEEDSQALRPLLHPLFQKYGVILVFQGHDHIYYRTRQDGITYVVTGGGGAELYDKVREPAPGEVFEKVNHFCIADVGRERVTVTTYRRDLSQVDRFELPLTPRPAA